MRNILPTFVKCVLITALFSSTLAFAETPLTCPSIDSIRHMRDIWPHGSWLPLYVDNEELVSDQDMQNFIATTSGFDKAEWSGNFLESGHCFYRGNNKITIARDMMKPDLTKNKQWKWDEARGAAHCHSFSENKCQFGGVA